jgi:hypothetical protein
LWLEAVEWMLFSWNLDEVWMVSSMFVCFWVHASISFFLSFSIAIRSSGMDVIFHTYNELRVHICINPLILSDIKILL